MTSSKPYNETMLGEHEETPNAKRALLVDSTGTAFSAANPLPVDATIEAGDIEIGAVEIKNGADDTRAVVKSDGTENALVVTQNALKATDWATDLPDPIHSGPYGATGKTALFTYDYQVADKLNDVKANQTNGTQITGINSIFDSNVSEMLFVKPGTTVWNNEWSVPIAFAIDEVGGQYVTLMADTNQWSLLTTAIDTAGNKQTFAADGHSLVEIITPLGVSCEDEANSVVLVGVKGSVAYDNSNDVFKNQIYGLDVDGSTPYPFSAILTDWAQPINWTMDRGMPLLAQDSTFTNWFPLTVDANYGYLWTCLFDQNGEALKFVQLGTGVYNNEFAFPMAIAIDYSSGTYVPLVADENQGTLLVTPMDTNGVKQVFGASGETNSRIFGLDPDGTTVNPVSSVYLSGGSVATGTEYGLPMSVNTDVTYYWAPPLMDENTYSLLVTPIDTNGVKQVFTAAGEAKVETTDVVVVYTAYATTKTIYFHSRNYTYNADNTIATETITGKTDADVAISVTRSYTYSSGNLTQIGTWSVV